jgi:dephospho-CoA kinase
MGKSTAAEMLRDMKGVAVHCSDDAVRRLYDDPKVIGLIKSTFPESYDKKRGRIDKKALLDTLNQDHEKWDVLEEILHPFVQDLQKKWLQLQQTTGMQIAVLDIPLLFETGAEQRVDFTIVVTAPAHIQAQRVFTGRNMDEDDFYFRLARQMPDEEKKRLADFVVSSGIGRAHTRRELEKIVQRLKTRNQGQSYDDKSHYSPS